MLEYLQARPREWVPGMKLMNKEVGGIRAGARIYDLRKDGHDIRTGTDPNSDVDRYMYVPPDEKPVQLTVEDIWG